MAGEQGDPDADEESPLEEVVSGAVIGVTLLVAFGLMAAGVPYFWVAFVVGFAGVLPTSLGLVRYYERRRERERTDGPAPGREVEDALEELRERYARGELSDREFEHRVERLLETESVHDAREYVDRVRAERTADGRVGGGVPADGRDPDPDPERETHPDRESDFERETE